MKSVKWWVVFLSLFYPNLAIIKSLEKDKLKFTPETSSQAVAHPLDPLTEHEIKRTTNIIKNYQAADWVFNYITLQEPEKAVLLPYFLSDSSPPTGSVPRRSFALIHEQLKNQVVEVTINLNSGVVEKWENAAAGVDPVFTVGEKKAAFEAIRANETVIERCKLLGWTNMSLVMPDVWGVGGMGYVGDMPRYQGKRLLKGYMYGKMFDQDNEFAHPFDFISVVDVIKQKVIAIEDVPIHDDFDVNNKVGNVVPKKSVNYDHDLLEPNLLRNDLRPVCVTQPHGTSFNVIGNELKWQKFKMRLGFNGREGLVIHNLNYNDSGTVRPLFYRMSMTEIFVPYGDPRPPFHRKHPFDGGQFGLGITANELISQVDCIGEVFFLDAILNNENGEPRKIPQVVCVFENDAGILWKHTDSDKKASVTRSQRLTLTYTITVGNYDYIITWHFHQDATIEHEVKMTGILSTALLAVNATPGGWGSIVSPGINAHYHQHFFSLRLDPEIDGTGNTVAISDVVPMSEATGSSQNPYGQGFTSNVTELHTAASARSNVSPEKSRVWLIRNPNKLNPTTQKPVGWKLMAWPSPMMMLRKDCPIHAKAEWMDYNTWVTPYKENQLFPGGYYLNNSGLPDWIRDDPSANINNTDVVLWHNFGISHLPRVEDFPVMPTETIKVVLKPYNFFTTNPALDVPPPKYMRQNTEL